jgi:hypothetical protein
MFVNTVDTFEPAAVTAPMQTSAINAMSSGYSSKSCPSASKEAALATAQQHAIGADFGAHS